MSQELSAMVKYNVFNRKYYKNEMENEPTYLQESSNLTKRKRCDDIDVNEVNPAKRIKIDSTPNIQSLMNELVTIWKNMKSVRGKYHKLCDIRAFSWYNRLVLQFQEMLSEFEDPTMFGKIKKDVNLRLEMAEKCGRNRLAVRRRNLIRNYNKFGRLVEKTFI